MKQKIISSANKKILFLPHAFKIENPELENEFIEVAQNQKKSVEDVVIEAMKYFINMQKEDKLIYTKKDPLKYLHKIERNYDEEMCDDVALTHIVDSASYIHNLRRQKNHDRFS